MGNVTKQTASGEKNDLTTATFPYWVNEVYSLGDWLKDYAYYSQEMPLFTFMDHGMSLSDKIAPLDLNNDAPLIFKFSPRLVALYKKQSKKPVYNLLNPSVHYRITHEIKKSETARGSLFFVGHSTQDIDDLTDWDLFIEELKKIPQAFFPIDVCLHPTDVQKGVGEIFEQSGFKVVSAGSAHSKEFIEKFYDLLSSYNYTLSNLLGSYVFYSVEMGIPFSLYGEEPKYFNKGDGNVEPGAYESYKLQPTYQKAKALFQGLYTSITKEQAYFVDYELGKYTTISRKKAAFLLYKAYFISALRKPKYFKYLKWALSDTLKRKNRKLYLFIRSMVTPFKKPQKHSRSSIF